MADFFGFDVAPNGGLRIVYNDTTNDDDGAGLFFTRQIAGDTVNGTTITGQPARDPVADPAGDAQYPHYSRAGVGPNLPQLDLTGLKVMNPDAATLRFQLSVADLSQLLPPAGKSTPLWLVRFQALGPLVNAPQDVYHVYYVYMQKLADVVPQFYAGVATCQDTTPNNCKVLEYGTDRAVTGSISGNTITIDVAGQDGVRLPDRRSEPLQRDRLHARPQQRGGSLRRRRCHRAVRLQDRLRNEVSGEALKGPGRRAGALPLTGAWGRRRRGT